MQYTLRKRIKSSLKAEKRQWTLARSPARQCPHRAIPFFNLAQLSGQRDVFGLAVVLRLCRGLNQPYTHSRRRLHGSRTLSPTAPPDAPPPIPPPPSLSGHFFTTLDYFNIKQLANDINFEWGLGYG